MFFKLSSLVEEINLIEVANFSVKRETLVNDIIKILNWLSKQKQERNIEFVHGIGKRKSKIQKWMEQLEEYKDRQEKYNLSKN